MIFWTARSVIPTRDAKSRMRALGSAAIDNKTWAWFVKKVHDGATPSFPSPDRSFSSLGGRFSAAIY
jgi:hypothetical protein